MDWKGTLKSEYQSDVFDNVRKLLVSVHCTVKLNVTDENNKRCIFQILSVNVSRSYRVIVETEGRHYMAQILSILRKTLSNQSINQSKPKDRLVSDIALRNVRWKKALDSNYSVHSYNIRKSYFLKYTIRKMFSTCNSHTAYLNPCKMSTSCVLNIHWFFFINF